MPETKKKSAASSTTRRATTATAAKKPAAKSTTKATTKPAARSTTKPAAKAKPKAPARKKPAADEAEATPRKRAIAGAAAAVKALRGAAPPGEPKRRKKPAAPAELPETDGVTRRVEAAQALALKAATVGLEKKAERIEIIDVSDKLDYTDFLVLMSGRSDRQVKSVAEGILASVEAMGASARSVEGLSQGHWVLVDLGDVIVHVFLDEARSYYDLEGFWIDAKRVPVEGAATDGPPRA